jgi:cytochrome c-type biogenesis protein CcmH
MKTRRIIFLLTFICALFSSFCYAIDPLPFGSTSEEERFQKLTAQLRCMQCQNQNLADSDAVIAQDMRKIVLEQMQGGKSDAQIKVFFVERYGPFAVYMPPVNLETIALWLAPLAFLSIALWVFFRHRRAQRGNASPAAASTAPTAANPAANPATNPEDW